MGKEFELRYAANGDVMAALERDFPGLKPITMETAYYDDECRTLGRLHWTLRRRMENGVAVCALKTPGTDGVTGEWEVREGDISQAIPQLRNLGAPEGIAALGPLTQVCAARFTRRALLLELPGCTAELARDRGVLRGGGRELPLCEVEVELKSGSRTALEHWCAAFAQRYGLKTEDRSKFARANALAQEG